MIKKLSSLEIVWQAVIKEPQLRVKEWLHDLTNYEAKRKLNLNALAPPYPFSETLPDNPFRKDIVEIKDEEEEVSVECLVFSNLIMRLLTCAR